MKISRRKFLVSASVVISSASLYSYFETQRILKTKIEVGLGSKIAFMADTHTHDFGIVEQRVIKMLAEEDPDIIFMEEILSTNSQALLSLFDNTFLSSMLRKSM